MFRIAAIAALLSLLAGCMDARVNPATSRAQDLPDFTGTYDMVVGADFEETMDKPGVEATTTLTREGNHYILRVESKDGSGPPARNEILYVAGPPDQMILAYARQTTLERVGIFAARALENGTLEVLMTSGSTKDPAPQTVIDALGKLGYAATRHAFTLELLGSDDLAELRVALWDPALVAAYEPKVLFRLTPVPD
jgi:hypothetical protein